MLQLLISGVVLGSVYALLAMSFNIIYRVSHVVNFAQGEVMAIAPLMAYTFAVTLKLSWVLVLPAAVLCSVLLALVIEVVAVRSVILFGGRSRDNHQWILSTFGASLLLQNVYQQYWGALELPALSIFGDKVIRLGGAGISTQGIGIICTALVVFGLVYFLSERTKFGRSSDAVSQQPDVASLHGINPSRIITLNWVLAAAIAGVAGLLVAPLLVLNATMGFSIAIKAFAAMIIGGLGNPKGAILAGFFIGIFEGIVARWVDGGYLDTLTLILLVGVLYVRPSGVFGRGEVVRA